MNITRMLIHTNGDYTEAYSTPSLDDDVAGRKPLASIRSYLLEDPKTLALWESLIQTAHHVKRGKHID